MTNSDATGEELFGPEFDVYRALVEGIPAILYIDSLDEWSTNWYTSPQAERLLGFTVEEWGTTPDLWLQRIHPDDRDRVKDENDRSNESREPFKSEYRFITKDGRTVWLRDEALVVSNGGERPFWRGFMHDITAQKEAEEKLRWSLEVLRRTIQQRRELALRLESAQEEERRRIAADIHDDPIQVMSAVDLRMGMMVERDEPVDPASSPPCRRRCGNRSNGSGRCCSSSVRRRSTVTGWWRPSRSTCSTPRRKRDGRSRSWTDSSSSPIPSSGPRSTARRRRRWPTPGSTRPPRAWWSR